MGLIYENMNFEEREIFVVAWELAQEMLDAVLERLDGEQDGLLFIGDDDPLIKWFKVDVSSIEDGNSLSQIVETLTKIKNFLDRDFEEGNFELTIRKIADNSIEEEIHGYSEIRSDDNWSIGLPSLFFNERHFKRQSDVLIHEISHLAANTADLEMPPRAGNASEPFNYDPQGVLQSSPVKRTDKYYRYHTAKLDRATAITCASSYKFYVKDMWRIIKEKKNPLQPIPIDGVDRHEIPGDGDCLYRAVGFYLGNNSDEHVLRLRNQVADYILQHIVDFWEPLQGLLPDGENLEDYIDGVRNRRAWADNIEIVALMHILNRPIIIIDNDSNVRENGYEQFIGEPVFVHYNGHNHYEAYRLQQNPNGYDIGLRLGLQFNLRRRASIDNLLQRFGFFNVPQERQDNDQLPRRKSTGNLKYSPI